MNFPQKLQEYRRTSKLSQEELANRLGVSRQSVSKWEQGMSFPETEKLIELSSMMGVTIDSLLKEEADPAEQTAPEALADQPDQPETTPPVQTSVVRRNWLTIFLACLLAVTSLALALVLWQNRDDSDLPPGETLQAEQTNPESTTEPPVTESVQTEPVETVSEPTELPATEPTQTEPVQTEPEPSEPGMVNKDLTELQSWFFDFAREYRLDYMPQFTWEGGAPKDSGEYLYWAFAINLDNWGEDKGKMTRTYVEETVLLYYAVIPEQHRSHRKAWDYDTKTQIYTAYPDSLRDLPYYLLNSIEVDQGVYTVRATCYQSPYLVSEETDERLKLALMEGTNTEMTPISEITLTFQLDHVFHKPVFKAFVVTEIQ